MTAVSYSVMARKVRALHAFGGGVGNEGMGCRVTSAVLVRRRVRIGEIDGGGGGGGGRGDGWESKGRRLGDVPSSPCHCYHSDTGVLPSLKSKVFLFSLQ